MQQEMAELLARLAALEARVEDLEEELAELRTSAPTGGRGPQGERYVAPAPPGYFTPADLVARWGVTSRTVYTWLAKRWIQGRRRGKRWIVKVEEAERWEREHAGLREAQEGQRGRHGS